MSNVTELNATDKIGGRIHHEDLYWVDLLAASLAIVDSVEKGDEATAREISRHLVTQEFDAKLRKVMVPETLKDKIQTVDVMEVVFSKIFFDTEVEDED